MEALSKKQYEVYHESVIQDHSCSIDERIPKSKKAGQITMIKHNVELFSCLYIVMQYSKNTWEPFLMTKTIPILLPYLTEGNYDKERSQIC